MIEEFGHMAGWRGALTFIFYRQKVCLTRRLELNISNQLINRLE